MGTAKEGLESKGRAFHSRLRGLFAEIEAHGKVVQPKFNQVGVAIVSAIDREVSRNGHSPAGSRHTYYLK